MYARSSGQRQASYSYPQYPVSSPPKHYPAAHSTSSAFSASANPNEDWTKISDLAERRRIQNRIAQRNYRKKLKKRLEDLERRAGSSSASPEQQHAELADPTDDDQHDGSSSSERRRSTQISSQSRRAHTPEALQQQYSLPGEDRGTMFSQQYTRQLSTSPPPFSSYAPMQGADTSAYGSFPPTTYCTIPGAPMEIPQYSSYLPHQMQAHYGGSISGTLASTPSMPKESMYAADEDMNPFAMSYASMAGVDVSAAARQPTYQDMTAYTPSLSDSFDLDLSHAESPPETLLWPVTPPTLSLDTPHLSYYGSI